MEENGRGPGTRSWAKASFLVGQYVRISKERMWFAMSAAQNFSTEILRDAKVIDRRPGAVYELEDLKGTNIDDQFYREELTPYR